jgi:hypothetical protein
MRKEDTQSVQCGPSISGLAVVMLLISRPALLHSQERLTIGPFVGVFISTGQFHGPLRTIFPESGVYRHRTAVALGVAGTFWVTPEIGVGGAFAWAPSDVQQAPPADSVFSASVQVLAAFLSVRLKPEEGPYDIRLRAGVGQMAHVGRFYEPLGNTKPLAAFGAIETAYSLTPQLKGIAGFDAYFYSFQLSGSTITPERHLMIDLVVRVGLNWSVLAHPHIR